MIIALQPAYLNREETAKFVGLSDTTMEQLARAGDFPKPRQLAAKRVGWLVSELQAWAESRPVSDLPPPRNTGVRHARATAAQPDGPSAQTEA